MRDSLIPNVYQATVITTVTIEFPLGTLSDSIGQRIVDIEPIFLKLGSGGASTRITVENSSLYGTKVDTLWNQNNPVNGSPVTITATIDGTAYPVFVGIVTGVSDWSMEAVSFECASVAEKYRRLIGTVLTSDDYPNIPDANVGRIIPWVWGTVEGFKPIMVDDDLSTQLSVSMLAADTVAHVQSVDDFPTSGSIRINAEQIAYSGVDTTDPDDHQFTGLTRAQGSTVASSHVAGNQVIEYNTVEYLVANHAVTSITNARYIADDGTPCLIDSGDYTVTLTKPARITFTQAPTVLVPSAVHKLKTVEMDDVYYNSGVDNPLFAVGADPTWTEYNYAELDGSDLFTLRRTAAVDSPGKLVRAFLVVEHWQSEANALKASWNGDLTGYYIPEDTDTPVDVMEDHTIHAMSAGFEDQHSHEIPGAIHNHSLVELASGALTPDIDTRVDSGATWGTLDNAYDGSFSSYADVDMGDTSGNGDTRFHYCNVSESVNLKNKIKMIRARIRLQSTTGAFDDCSTWLHIPASKSGSTDYEYLFSSIMPDTETEWLTDWIDVSSYGLYSIDLASAYFRIYFLYEVGENETVRVYDMEIYTILESEGYRTFVYEPCTVCDNSAYNAACDGSYTTYVSIPVGSQNPKFGWVSNSNWTGTVSEVGICVMGGHVECQALLYVGGTLRAAAVLDVDSPYYVFGTTLKWGYLTTPAGAPFTGWDLIQSNAYIQLIQYGATTDCRVIEVGLWVSYEGDVGGWTGLSDIGDSDQQEGEKSHLHWLDITDDISDWPDLVNKQIAFQCQGGSMTAKILRAHYAIEFAPQETKAVKEIVCDVVGRTGTTYQMITDIAKETDLLGIPSDKVTIPTTLTSTRAGAVTEQVDGLVLLDNVATEATCHLFWGWDGKLHAKERSARENIGTAGIEFSDCIGMNRGIKELSDMATKIQVFYNYNYADDQWGGDETATSQASMAKYGVDRVESAELYFTRAQADAALVANFLLSYLRECWETIDPTVMIYGLNVEPGDLISVDTEGVDAKQIEVKEIRVNGLIKEDLTVELQGVKYDI